MKRPCTTASILFAAAAVNAADADDQIFVGSPSGSVYVGSSATGEFTYFACFCIGPVVSIEPLGSDMLVADSFGGLWQLDGLTGEFETGAWTGRQLTDMAVDGEDALLVESDGTLSRASLATGFPVTPIPAPEGVSSLLLFDGDLYVGTESGMIYKQEAGTDRWDVFSSMPTSVRTLAARSDAMIAADADGNAASIAWGSGENEGYYAVDPGVVDAGQAGDRTLFIQSPGAVDVFDTQTQTMIDTWTVPVEISAISIRPGTVCKADTNRNGTLEAGDFNAWVAAFNRGDFLADQNNDLAITAADFNAWILAFNAGCN